MINCIGIDVSKQSFDVFVLEKNKAFTMSNDSKGIDKCVELCHQIRPELIVMEATGGYEAHGLRTGRVVPFSTTGVTG